MSDVRLRSDVASGFNTANSTFNGKAGGDGWSLYVKI